MISSCARSFDHLRSGLCSPATDDRLSACSQPVGGGCHSREACCCLHRQRALAVGLLARAEGRPAARSLGPAHPIPRCARRSRRRAAAPLPAPSGRAANPPRFARRRTYNSMPLPRCPEPCNAVMDCGLHQCRPGLAERRGRDGACGVDLHDDCEGDVRDGYRHITPRRCCDKPPECDHKVQLPSVRPPRRAHLLRARSRRRLHRARADDLRPVRPPGQALRMLPRRRSARLPMQGRLLSCGHPCPAR